jgi:1-deoxy-D-xylulose-5-phosphate reductoisomerase
MERNMQRITILGATGSIGVSTLDVLARHPDKYRVYALSAHERVDALAAQCRVFRPQRAVVGTPEAAARLRDLLGDLPSPTAKRRCARSRPVRTRIP